MTAPGADRIQAAIRATWPPSALHRIGPFDLPAEQSGTRRATSARLRAGAVATADDIIAVQAARPGTIFGTTDGIEDALADTLLSLGYQVGGISDLMAGPVAPLLGELPRISGFAHWPPLAICDALWDAHGNDASRRAPMYRTPDPRTAILLRANDRAAGALFAGIHDSLAVLHMVLTLPAHRCQGLGMLGMRHAANWAQQNGATHIVLPVEADNLAATTLYARAGLVRCGGYRYWSLP